MTQLWGVMRQDVERAWVFVGGLVAEACACSQLHTPEAIRDDLLDGTAQLWVAWEGDVNDKVIRACTVTKLERRGAVTWCRAILVAGDQPDDWFDHLAMIEKWAKANGAQQMNFIGRCGLEKWLKPRGYKRTHFLMEKAL